MTNIVPAIIADSLDDLKREVALVAPYVDLVQVDIMDGVFAPSQSWPYKGNKFDELASLQSKEELLGVSGVDFELDVMVAEPLQYMEVWQQVGVRTFILHVESVPDIQLAIEYVKEKGVRVALACIPSTPNETMYPWIEHIDFVQFMGNDKIGYHGVKLDERVLHKISDLRARFKELIIGVDIGVNVETAPKLINAGANKLVSGSAIFNSGNIGEAIEGLQNS